MSSEDGDKLFARALKAVKDFLHAKADFEAIQDIDVGNRVTIATAGRFVEAHEEMMRAVDALEGYEKSLLIPPTN